MEPNEQEVRAAFEAVQLADKAYYAGMDLNAFLVGYCMAKGMTAIKAVPFVKENGVKEDGK